MSDILTAQRKMAVSKGQAMKGGSFPIRNGADLSNAIRAVGRANGGAAGQAAVRRFIMKRASAMNMTSAVPATWNSDGTLKS